MSECLEVFYVASITVLFALSWIQNYLWGKSLDGWKKSLDTWKENSAEWRDFYVETLRKWEEESNQLRKELEKYKKQEGVNLD